MRLENHVTANSGMARRLTRRPAGPRLAHLVGLQDRAVLQEVAAPCKSIHCALLSARCSRLLLKGVLTRCRPEGAGGK